MKRDRKSYVTLHAINGFLRIPIFHHIKSMHVRDPFMESNRTKQHFPLLLTHIVPHCQNETVLQYTGLNRRYLLSIFIEPGTLIRVFELNHSYDNS